MSGADLTLAELPVGGMGVVTRVGCPRAVACRLMEMGLLPGTLVRVVRIAPLGDPIELELRGYLLSIRVAEARGIAMRDAREPDALVLGDDPRQGNEPVGVPPAERAS